jgi:uncharacterized membrane protein
LIFCIPARWITPAFVTCDVVTILIQVSGTTISAGDDWVGKTAQIGSYVLLSGLALQTVTVALFLAVIVRFSGRELLRSPSTHSDKVFPGIRATFASSIFIEVMLSHLEN